MFGDDNDDEEPTAGANRYPVMPSLVALQQMRNRLHMGELGQKLMKWTSVATGQELRKISADIQMLYQGFQDDVQQAFILLARSRYFFPDLNKMVVEDLQFGASLTVAASTRLVTGVRILEYHILEHDSSYDYLGLGQGGETIYDTKQAWIQLLKLEIKMAELRTSYVLVEAAHKSATKRLNIINKIVIPKTKVTMKYIILELEETAREELHRIKKVKECKNRKKAKAKPKKSKVYSVCSQPLDRPGDVCDKAEELQTIVNSQPSPVKTPEIKEEIIKLSQSISFEPPQAIIQCPHKTPSSYIDRPSELVAVHDPLPESKRDLFMPWCCMDKPFAMTRGPSAHISLGDISSGSKLQQLKNMLNDAINLGQAVAQTEGETAEINEFLKLCKDAQIKLDLAGGQEKLGDTTSLIAANLEHLKCHIQHVINVSRELRNITFLSPSIENFVQSCENVDKKINLAIKNVKVAPADQTAKDNFKKLGNEIDDIMRVIENYKEEGLLKEDVEDFTKICNITKSKLDCYGKELNPADEKLDHLKTHISKLEEISKEIKRNGVRSASIEKFLSSCKDFKVKLEKQKEEKTCGSKSNHVSRLIERIDDTLKSTKEAKEEGIISESIENFIRSCEIFKSRIGSKNSQNFETGTVQKTQSDIQSVMQLIKNLQNQGLITDSMAEFLRDCEEAKNKLDLDEDGPLCQESNVILSPTCGELSTCESRQVHGKGQLCDNCKDVYGKDKDSDDETDIPAPSCDTCLEGEQQDKVKLNTPCDSCLNVDLEETDCDDCGECGPPPVEAPVEAPVEDTAGGLGLFEKKVKTITKITRYRTATGDIREEKEVTTIKKTKHDPDETDIDHDDESDDSFEVGVCLTPNLNEMGFRQSARKSKSEQLFRESSLTNPRFKQSISFNPQVLFMRNPLQSLFKADTEATVSTISLCLYPNITL